MVDAGTNFTHSRHAVGTSGDGGMNRARSELEYELMLTRSCSNDGSSPWLVRVIRQAFVYCHAAGSGAAQSDASGGGAGTFLVICSRGMYIYSLSLITRAWLTWFLGFTSEPKLATICAYSNNLASQHCVVSSI
jgi:hypothetical protein